MTQEIKEWYPSELFLEERHAKEAIQYAEAILHWAKDVIENNNRE